MVVESILALIGQDLISGNNHYELVALSTIIHNAVLIFCFLQRKYVRYAPVSKTDISEPVDSGLRPNGPFPCIVVNTYKTPTCLVDVLH